MLDFLTTALFMQYDILDGYTALLVSYVVVIGIPLPLWIAAGVQDYKTHEIGTPLLVCIMLLTFAHALLFVNPIVAAIILVMAWLAFRQKEIPIIGQADFVLFAHWVSASFCFHSGAGVMLVSSCVFLICIIIYLAVYRDVQGRGWKPKKMVPLFPPYSATVLIMFFVQLPISRLFYELGW